MCIPTANGSEKINAPHIIHMYIFNDFSAPKSIIHENFNGHPMEKITLGFLFSFLVTFK